MKKERLTCCKGYRKGSNYFHLKGCSVSEFYVWMNRLNIYFTKLPNNEEEINGRISCLTFLFRQGMDVKK